MLAEVLVPLWRTSSCGGGAAPLWRPDESAGWALRPNATGENVVCDGPRVVARQVIAINDLGQRDRPRTIERRDGRPRVLVLGDSFVEAVQVGLEDTFAARIESASGIEMMNGGVSGYSTDNELRAFVATGRAYQPDAVLLVLYVGNDVEENGARLYLADPHGLPPKRWLRSDDAPLGLATCLALHRTVARTATALPGVLWDHSRLVRAGLTSGASALLEVACTRSVGPPTFDDGPERLGVYREPATEGWREAWATTESLLGQVRVEIERLGIRFGVVIAPAGVEIDPRQRIYEVKHPRMRQVRLDFEYPHRRLGRFLDGHGIAWVSLLEPMRENLAATGRSGYFASDGHWDAEGHAAVARALEPFVRSLVAREPAPDRPWRGGLESHLGQAH